ncbi:TRAFs-binding domain-containing protein [Pararcticibacter amylolyticus]|uniref:DUF4071 domain-containing protein n=1 Tax=Pararcticibacter amylolyticus TaxID=2173175 RepID=A0A2U2PIG9_9SPHI|nr:TRAFs-binding domain-containing protein [Pararcticibacter amylolyticus]PWG81181.1 DUF4071 domain-containing protein [Pararcticibacter amylolyticus]
MAQRLCFVIMGFGKKTDPSTGNTIDLDQTYKNIIKPAVIESGLDCVRADEVKESGLIDKSMYALLMYADLVIADISTYNPNALYELGIRHAVRPFSTIILKERSGKVPFDLDHNRIFQYTHLGEDIGVDESHRCRQELVDLIHHVEMVQQIDSPLYEYLSNVNPPTLPPEEYKKVIGDLADKEERIFAIVERAKQLFADEDNAKDAAVYWEKAHKIVPSEPYFVQQLALCIYKAKYPTEQTALVDALRIISQLDPEGDTNDPETLGITGAIYKNLWLFNKDIGYLDRALGYYGKGFKIRNDYYNGENYALCSNFKSISAENIEERVYYKVEARKTREHILEILLDIINRGDIDQRIDKCWIYATMANCYFATEQEEKGIECEKWFYQITDERWKVKTYIDNKSYLLSVIKRNGTGV